MKIIFIMLDSLNRRYLSVYNKKATTIIPNIERLARRSMIFDNHWCGSAPCMPARRDILTGRLNFMERPWGGIEPFDHVLPVLLKTQNVYSHIETDHFHYSETGGENYISRFTSWNLHRGAEHDTINWGPDQSGIPHQSVPEGYTGIYSPSYDLTKRMYAGKKENYSTSRTFLSAIEWLKRNRNADNYLLWIEGFDPHEPFDAPDEFLDLYDFDSLEEKNAYWPDYDIDHYSESQRKCFQLRYQALVTMTDYYLGKLLDEIDDTNAWKDTMIIFTTDHGYMLGEHGYWAKNYMPDYSEVFHIPLIIAAPNIEPGRCNAVTENIDLFPTILNYFNVDQKHCRNPIHGKDLFPLLNRTSLKIRDAALFGTFGKSISLVDGRYIYVREPAEPQRNKPLYIYGSTMTLLNQYIGYDTMSPDEIRRISFAHLSWTDYPVYKIPATCVHWKNDSERFDRINRYAGKSRLYDLEKDYGQEHPVSDDNLEKQYMELLKRTMKNHDSPAEQFERIGL
jgi:arylsulfatase A-like enzyme